MKENLKTQIEVKNKKIGIMRIGDVGYIFLTDLAKYDDSNDHQT